MTWTVRIEKPAERDLAGLDAQTQRQILKKLKWFREHFDEAIRFVLHGDWSEYWKLRAGDWRIMYTVDRRASLIRIWHIARRDKIYKRNT